MIDLYPPKVLDFLHFCCFQLSLIKAPEKKCVFHAKTTLQILVEVRDAQLASSLIQIFSRLPKVKVKCPTVTLCENSAQSWTRTKRGVTCLARNRRKNGRKLQVSRETKRWVTQRSWGANRNRKGRRNPWADRFVLFLFVRSNQAFESRTEAAYHIKMD